MNLNRIDHLSSRSITAYVRLKPHVGCSSTTANEGCVDSGVVREVFVDDVKQTNPQTRGSEPLGMIPVRSESKARPEVDMLR